MAKELRMAQSFTAAAASGTSGKGSGGESGKRRKVRVTGAAGNIGAYFSEHSSGRYDLRLMVHEIDDDARKIETFGELVTGDVTRLDDMKKQCQGVDTVLHLAANPSPEATWESVRDVNIA